MSQLTNIPLQDNYKSTLSQIWDGNVWTIYVNTTPSFTFPSWVKTYICVDPWKTNMQVARISAYDATLKTITVDNITLDKWNGVAYTAQTHTVGSVIEISDNYQFREDILTAINTKVNTNSTDTDTWKFADATARDAYFTSPVNWNSAYLTSLWARTDYIGGAWSTRATGSVVNASTTVAGKVEKATSGEVTAWTATGWTGAELFVWPAELKVVTDAILSPIYFWDWADGDVTISSWTTTLTRDMYYNNLTITSPWVLNPNGYRVFVKWTIAGTGTINRNGNNGWNWSNWVAWTAATTLWQWSLNAEVASVAWRAGNNSSWQNWIAWTAATNSLSNISSVAWWAWWAWWAGNLNPWWSAWASAASTRSNTYNKVFPLQLVHPATAWALTQATGISSSWWWASWSWDNGGYHNWWSWGWSWGNWGLIWIFANTWNFTWTCTATGWTGGNWSNAYIVVWGWSNAGWWGWGGWGNGGILLRCYKTLTADCTKTLTWWTWWTAWTGISWWANWTAGQNWNAGTTITITV